VLGIVGILDDVTKAVPAHFQKADDAIVLLWPIPEGETPDPNLKVPLAPLPVSQYPTPVLESEPRPRLEPDASADDSAANLTTFGSSEYAKEVLGGTWGQPPALDLAAEANLHTLLIELAWRKLVHSSRDISDGGIAVALAQSTFQNRIGATVEQDESLMAHPFFGLFAEPASTILVTADPGKVKAIEELAGDFGFFVARIGTTGGNRIEINVDREPMISASIESLRKPWATALEATLHGEVLA